MLKQRNINRKQKIQAQSASEMTIDQPNQHIAQNAATHQAIFRLSRALKLTELKSAIFGNLTSSGKRLSLLVTVPVWLLDSSC